MCFLLERANEAEDRADALQRQVDALRGSLQAALNMDPTAASRAVAWVGRAENSERLVGEVLRYVKQRSITSIELPPGWVTRAEAQLRAVEIMHRDLGLERPDEGDYWATGVTPDGRRTVMRDDPQGAT